MVRKGNRQDVRQTGYGKKVKNYPQLGALGGGGRGGAMAPFTEMREVERGRLHSTGPWGGTVGAICPAEA